MGILMTMIFKFFNDYVFFILIFVKIESSYIISQSWPFCTLVHNRIHLSQSHIVYCRISVFLHDLFIHILIVIYKIPMDGLIR